MQNLALLRLDADYYESAMDALEPLYPKLSSGGFIIIDDYGIYNLGAAWPSTNSAAAATSDNRWCRSMNAFLTGKRPEPAGIKST